MDSPLYCMPTPLHASRAVRNKQAKSSNRHVDVSVVMSTDSCYCPIVLESSPHQTIIVHTSHSFFQGTAYVNVVVTKDNAR
jgi:hypothetical protein